MELISTIEISPYDYTEKEYPFPDSSIMDTPEEWTKFWYQCISDSGLQNLVPIEVGSYLVDMNTISNSELAVILKKKLADVKLEGYEDQVGKLDGGLVVKNKGAVIISPTCCGDIANLTGSEAIFTKEPNEWHELWIGHPWLFYKRHQGFIEFSDYIDVSLCNATDIDVMHKLSEKEFLVALQAMRANQITFENRIATALRDLQITPAKEIAKLMTGN